MAYEDFNEYEQRSLRFVRNCYREKEEYLKAILTTQNNLAGKKIAQLSLSPEQFQGLQEALDIVLTDIYYTLLLGLDGSASIGGNQEMYCLYDEQGQLISRSGHLEAAAYHYFQERNGDGF